MIVACVSRVEFNLDAKSHTVAYADCAKHMEFNTPNTSKLDHVVAQDLDQAKIMLSGVVKEYLRKCASAALNPADFDFTVHYQNVDGAGRFYAHHGYAACGGYVHDIK